MLLLAYFQLEGVQQTRAQSSSFPIAPKREVGGLMAFKERVRFLQHQAGVPP